MLSVLVLSDRLLMAFKGRLCPAGWESLHSQEMLPSCSFIPAANCNICASNLAQGRQDFWKSVGNCEITTEVFMPGSNGPQQRNPSVRIKLHLLVLVTPQWLLGLEPPINRLLKWENAQNREISCREDRAYFAGVTAELTLWLYNWDVIGMSKSCKHFCLTLLTFFSVRQMGVCRISVCVMHAMKLSYDHYTDPRRNKAG